MIKILSFALLVALLFQRTPALASSSAHPAQIDCQVDHSSIDFGTRDHTAGTAVSFEIVVTCPAGMAYSISLLQQPRCDIARDLRDPRSNLLYTIFLPNRSQVWCDGTNGTAVYSDIGTGAPQHVVGFAMVRAERSNVRIQSATYVDHIIVLVSH